MFIALIVYLALGGLWLWRDERFHYYIAIYRRFPTPYIPMLYLFSDLVWPFIAFESLRIIVHNRNYVRRLKKEQLHENVN